MGKINLNSCIKKGGLFHVISDHQDFINNFNSGSLSPTYGDLVLSGGRLQLNQVVLIGNTTSYTLNLPTSIPINNGVLISDTSGNLSWTPLNLASGDIDQTSFTFNTTNSSPLNITGFNFDNSIIESFFSLVSVKILLTNSTSLNATYRISSIQIDSGWDNLWIENYGDVINISFNITSSGQIQYVFNNTPNFLSSTIKFRAYVLNI
jgi:hypothetical protein